MCASKAVVCVCDFNFGYFLSQKTQKRHRTFMCVVWQFPAGSRCVCVILILVIFLSQKTQKRHRTFLCVVWHFPAGSYAVICAEFCAEFCASKAVVCVCVILILVTFFDITPGQVLCLKLGLYQFPADSWLPRVARSAYRHTWDLVRNGARHFWRSRRYRVIHPTYLCAKFYRA